MRISDWSSDVCSSDLLGVTDDAAEIGFADGSQGKLPYAGLRWARKKLGTDSFGPLPKKPAEVVQVGDVIAVEPAGASPQDGYGLSQGPAGGGALVALDLDQDRQSVV